MICIILVAGHGTRLEQEIKEDTSGKYAHLVGVPKALFPVPEGKSILSLWWATVGKRQIFSDVFLVTNADKYKYYERWATANDFPRENIINDGTTSVESSLGAVADFELAVRSRHMDQDVMVIAGDMLFQEDSFDMMSVVRFFHSREGELAVYYEMGKDELSSSRGIVEVDKTSARITRFVEKPEPGTCTSRNASVVLFCFRKQTLPMVREYLNRKPDVKKRSFGHFMEDLVQKVPVYGMKLPTRFQLIGPVGIDEYSACIEALKKQKNHVIGQSRPITHRAYARVGLMGNPSDGFNGATISVSVKNYWAEATIRESERLELVRHPLNDPTEFGSLGDLATISQREGYQGGLRLMQATCKRFFEYCSDHGIALHRRNFKLSYDTNIPRQVGLSGSSAIVTATFKCLMDFYGVTNEDIPLELQPGFILSAETELGITAGLQDRVIQVYEGVVFMDFRKELLESRGYGEYVNLDPKLAPPLWLAYLAEPKDSGRMHNNVKGRWLAGDQEIVEGMKVFVDLTYKAKQALLDGDWSTLKDLMDLNFNQRLKLYGPEALGKRNLDMISIARKHGSSAKFPGSGNAVIGLLLDPQKREAMKEEFEANGCVFCDVVVNYPRRT